VGHRATAGYSQPFSVCAVALHEFAKIAVAPRASKQRGIWFPNERRIAKAFPCESLAASLWSVLEHDSLCPMKLRLDLVEHLTAQDLMEEVLANNHRYKPEPLLSKTGTGSLSPASTEERAQEEARNTALIQRLIQRSQENGTSNDDAVAPSEKRSTS